MRKSPTIADNHIAESGAGRPRDSRRDAGATLKRSRQLTEERLYISGSFFNLGSSLPLRITRDPTVAPASRRLLRARLALARSNFYSSA
jgi:hypothetical protein